MKKSAYALPLTEADLIAKGHTHIVENTLYYDARTNKQRVTIRTRGVDGSFDGNTREIATSDLHQTFWTLETKRLLDSAKRSLKRSMREVVVILEDEEAEALASV